MDGPPLPTHCSVKYSHHPPHLGGIQHPTHWANADLAQGAITWYQDLCTENVEEELWSKVISDN